MLVILDDVGNPWQSQATIPAGIATVGNPSGIAKPLAIPSGIAAGIAKITFGSSSKRDVFLGQVQAWISPHNRHPRRQRRPLWAA